MIAKPFILEDLIGYQENSVVSREIVRKKQVPSPYLHLIRVKD